MDFEVPYVVSGSSFVLSDTPPVVLPNTAPVEAKTNRGGGTSEEEVVVRESRTASNRFIVPVTLVRTQRSGFVSHSPLMAAAK